MKRLIWVGSSYSGIATPKPEIELLKNRLKEAKALYKSLVEGKQ